MLQDKHAVLQENIPYVNLHWHNQTCLHPT